MLDLCDLNLRNLKQDIRLKLAISTCYTFVNGEWEEKRRGNVRKEIRIRYHHPILVAVVHSSLRIIIHTLVYDKSKFSRYVTLSRTKLLTQETRLNYKNKEQKVKLFKILYVDKTSKSPTSLQRFKVFEIRFLSQVILKELYIK